MTVIAPYAGAPVSQTFRERWMTSAQLGDIAPVGMVEVRRGFLVRTSHPFDESDVSFGMYAGARAHGFWYPDWTPLEDWTTLDGVQNIKLAQSFDSNGVTTATIKMDNIKLAVAEGVAGIPYHTVERGYYSPLRGWVAYQRPDPGITKTPFFYKLVGAQIRVRQGYGADAMVTTFLGLVDDIDTNSVPNEITVTCRDFGCVLSDQYILDWATERGLAAPLTFTSDPFAILPNVFSYSTTVLSTIYEADLSDIVRSLLRWAGFKSWEVEDCGTGLASDFIVDSSMSFMDVINKIKDQVGFTFFIGEPQDDDDDLDIGYPIFRNTRVIEQYTAPTEFIDDSLLLTDAKVKRSNLDDRTIITTVGAAAPPGGFVDPAVGSYLQFGDLTFTYIPPWGTDGALVMAGLIRPIRHSDTAYTTIWDVRFAAFLIAIQIALAQYTITLDLPANPGIGLDTLQSVIDRTQGINSRVYVSNRTQEMQFGSNGFWTMELGGALADTPEIAGVVINMFEAQLEHLGELAAAAAAAAEIEKERLALEQETGQPVPQKPTQRSTVRPRKRRYSDQSTPRFADV